MSGELHDENTPHHLSNTLRSRFCDLGQTVFQLHGLYSMLVTNFGDLYSMLDPVFTVKASLLWAAVVYALVQVYSDSDVTALLQSCDLLPCIGIFWLSHPGPLRMLESRPSLLVGCRCSICLKRDGRRDRPDHVSIRF